MNADSPAPATQPTVRESDLYAPVKAHLEALGYVARAEVGKCDIVGINGDIIIGVELKLTFGLPVLYQALQRLPDGGPADLQRGGELPLGRQGLAGHELAQRNRGHERSRALEPQNDPHSA